MIREAPKVVAPVHASEEDAKPAPNRALRPPAHPTERSAAAYRVWPQRPGTAAAAGRRTVRTPAFGVTEAVNEAAPRRRPGTAHPTGVSWQATPRASGSATWAGGAGGQCSAGMSAVRLVHAPISTTEYVSRQRPMSAPPTKSHEGSQSPSLSATGLLRKTISAGSGGGGSGGGTARGEIAPAWRRSHYVAGEGEAAPKATSWGEVRQRQKHGGAVTQRPVGLSQNMFATPSSAFSTLDA